MILKTMWLPLWTYKLLFVTSLKKKKKKVRKKYFCLLGEYHPPPSPPTPGKEEGVPTRRGSDGKLRGRKRASDPAPPLDSEIEVNPWSHIVGNYQHFSPIFIFLSHTHSQTVMWLTLHICYFTAASVYLGSGWNHHYFPFAPHGNFLHTIWQGMAIWPFLLSFTVRSMYWSYIHTQFQR